MVLAHAAVWTRLDAPEWGEVWEVHLQLVGREDESRWTWRQVDLTGRPLSASPPGGLRVPRKQALPEEVLDSLLHWLESRRMEVLRSPQTDLVSGVGEDLAVFRRRVLAAARLAVLTTSGGGESARAQAPRALHALASSIERRELPLAGGLGARVQVGLLVVPSPDCLEPAGSPRDPMVSGKPRGG